MTAGSLRLRLLAAAGATVFLALAIAGVGLVVLFERHVERRIGKELDTYLNQMAARVAFGTDGAAAMSDRLADPRFEKVYGGLYWQVSDETTNALLRSRSLWDTRLALPSDVPAIGEIHVHDIDGPNGSRLLTHERRLLFDSPSGRKILRLAVAIDRSDVDDLTADFAMEVSISLLLLAVILILAGWIQVNVGLRPLKAVTRGLGAIRDGRAERLRFDVPEEIAPLVTEVNSLLDAQDKAMQRARDRAADLAHGLKTPLTALMADAKRLRAAGERATADEIEHTARAMHGHIDRELARSRLRNLKARAAIDVAPVADALVATLKRTPLGETRSFDTLIEPDAAVRAERDDLNDMLGNLLENAVRHASETVRLTVAGRERFLEFTVEDDGPGISADQLDGIVDRGRRLDSSPAGAGLGLAIVNDVLEHYEQSLSLGRSDLGGLKASFHLPR